MYVYNIRFISKYFYINANSEFEMLKGIISYTTVAPEGALSVAHEGALKAMQ
jgi:hypothetical protein